MIRVGRLEPKINGFSIEFWKDTDTQQYIYYVMRPGEDSTDGSLPKIVTIDLDAAKESVAELNDSS